MWHMGHGKKPLATDGNLDHVMLRVTVRWHTAVLHVGGSVLPGVCLTVTILCHSSFRLHLPFSALKLLIGRQEGHLAWKIPPLWGCDLPPEKIVWLNKTQTSVTCIYEHQSLYIITAIFQVNLGQPVFIEAKDDVSGGDNWTTGAISRAKL